MGNARVVVGRCVESGVTAATLEMAVNRAAMKQRLAILLIGSLAALPFAPAAAARDPIVAKAAAQTLDISARSAAGVVDAFHKALRRGDASRAMTLLASDVLIFESGEAERTKAEYASHHLAADVEFARAVPEVITRRSGRAYGDTAWIATEGRAKGSYKGKEFDRVTTETMVLRRTTHAWTIVHIHWSSTAHKGS